MTIKDVAAKTGLSHQAIYKRLKARGLSVSDLKDKATGHLTAEGERVLADMFSIQAEEPTGDDRPSQTTTEPTVDAVDTEAEELRNEVARLTTEVEKLRNRVETLEATNTALTSERDYLRLALERSQQLQMVTASKIPNPPPLLPATEAEEAKPHKGIFGGLRSWWARRREPQRETAGAHGGDDQNE